MILTGDRINPYIQEALRGNDWDQEEVWEDVGFVLGFKNDDGYNSDHSGIQEFLDGDEEVAPEFGAYFEDYLE